MPASRDQTPEERQILPGLGLFIGSSKQVGRMIADDGLRAEVADRHVVHASSLAADRSVGSQTEQRLHGEASHDEKHVGANEKKLPAQIGCAAGHLGGRGIAVSRRAALEHVHDRDVAAALDADALEHLREQLADLPTNGMP